MKPGHAEIVGAGFGGLVSAIALVERGWTVRVHERRGSLRGEGYGIAIHNNMARIFSAFGILDEVLAGGARIDRRDSVDAQGRVVMSRKTDRSPFRVERQHIIDLLARRAIAAGVQIDFLSQVTAADPAGAVTLADGTRLAADLIVAADGVNSAVREQLGLLKERLWGRDCGVRVTFPRRPDEIAEDARTGTVMIEAWSGRRRVLYCPVTRESFYALITCTMQDEKARTTPIDPDEWASTFPTMRDLFVRIRDTTDWTQTHWARFQTVRLKKWSEGRIAVLGDASHAMAPYLAQGAGHAMMNAVGLAAAIEEAPDMATAMSQWEARERPLTEHTQLWTRIYGTTMFLPRPLKRAWIRVERMPWIAAQYVKVAQHIPTGVAASPGISGHHG